MKKTEDGSRRKYNEEKIVLFPEGGLFPACVSEDSRVASRSRSWSLWGDETTIKIERFDDVAGGLSKGWKFILFHFRW